MLIIYFYIFLAARPDFGGPPANQGDTPLDPTTHPRTPKHPNTTPKSPEPHNPPEKNLPANFLTDNSNNYSLNYQTKNFFLNGPQLLHYILPLYETNIQCIATFYNHKILKVIFLR